jgi:hypothetical protein
VASHGFFEIAPGTNDDRLRALLGAAYRSSRQAPVFVRLRGVDPARLDELLNPVVAELGVAYAGVEFLVEEDVPRLRRLAESAAFRVLPAAF